MTKPKLTLFLDVVSPFAYLAFYVIENSPTFKDCDVTYIPIFLGGVMKACGNTPPINIKNKADWIGVERLRWAKYCNIPMAEEMPIGFPPNTLQVMRALSALEVSDPTSIPKAFEALYHSLWVEGKAAQKVEVFGPVLKRVLGNEAGASILDQMSSPEAKAKLLENTDLAVREGAFGLPWFIATNAQGRTEKYWGFDHLGQIIEHLGLERGNGLRAML